MEFILNSPHCYAVKWYIMKHDPTYADEAVCISTMIVNANILLCRFLSKKSDIYGSLIPEII